MWSLEGFFEMKFEYSELCALLTRLISMEKTPRGSNYEQWEQEKLNSAIAKLEAEATRLRKEIFNR